MVLLVLALSASSQQRRSMLGSGSLEAALRFRSLCCRHCSRIRPRAACQLQRPSAAGIGDRSLRRSMVVGSPVSRSRNADAKFARPTKSACQSGVPVTLGTDDRRCHSQLLGSRAGWQGRHGPGPCAAAARSSEAAWRVSRRVRRILRRSARKDGAARRRRCARRVRPLARQRRQSLRPRQAAPWHNAGSGCSPNFAATRATRCAALQRRSRCNRRRT